MLVSRYYTRIYLPDVTMFIIATDTWFTCHLYPDLIGFGLYLDKSVDLAAQTYSLMDLTSQDNGFTVWR